MAAPPKMGSVFSPADLEQIARAYEAALLVVTAEATFATLSARDLQHRLAAVILAEASRGPVEARRLKEAALDVLRLLASDSGISAWLHRRGALD